MLRHFLVLAWIPLLAFACGKRVETVDQSASPTASTEKGAALSVPPSTLMYGTAQITTSATLGRETVTVDLYRSAGNRIGDQRTFIRSVEQNTEVVVAIRVAVHNTGKHPFQYTHPAKGNCRLSDEEGNVFLEVEVPDDEDTKLHGRTTQAQLQPKQSVTDLFLFSRANFGKGKALIFELPGTSMGGSGMLKMGLEQKTVPQ